MLQTISIPDCADVPSSAFENCNNLQYNVYDNGKYLGNEGNPYAVFVKMTDERVTSCILNPNTKVICEGAFSGSYIYELNIPEGVRYIGDAFNFCQHQVGIFFVSNVITIIKLVILKLAEISHTGTYIFQTAR